MGPGREGGDKWGLQQRPLCVGDWLRDALHLPDRVVVSSVWVPTLRGETQQENEKPSWKRDMNASGDSRKRLRTEGQGPVVLRRGWREKIDVHECLLSMSYNRKKWKTIKFPSFVTWLNITHSSIQ